MCERTTISDGFDVSAFAASMARSRALEIVHIRDALNVPAVGLEACSGVIAEREGGVALDRDVIVVVEADQLAELRVSGE